MLMSSTADHHQDLFHKMQAWNKEGQDNSNGNFALKFFVECFQESDGVTPHSAMDTDIAVSADIHAAAIEFRKLLVRIVLGWNGDEKANGFLIETRRPNNNNRNDDDDYKVRRRAIHFIQPMKYNVNVRNQNMVKHLPVAMIKFVLDYETRQEAQQFLKQQQRTTSSSTIVLLETTPEADELFATHLQRYGKPESSSSDVVDNVWSGLLVPTMVAPPPLLSNNDDDDVTVPIKSSLHSSISSISDTWKIIFVLFVGIGLQVLFGPLLGRQRRRRTQRRR